MPVLNASAQRVQRAFDELGLKMQVVELPKSTRTAEEAARAIGCAIAQIAKSLIFSATESDAPILVIASGVNRVNENTVAAILGEEIEKANAGFVRESTGYVIGGVPPVGHVSEIRTFIDEELFNYDQIWAAAGTPHAVFKLTPQDLAQATGGKVISIL